MMRSIPLAIVVSVAALAMPAVAPVEAGVTRTESSSSCAIAPGFVPPVSTGGPSVDRTCAVVQSFVNAYNRHDLSGVLAVVTPDARIGDCDYLRHSAFIISGKTAIAQWLRDRFAENDRFDVQVVVGGGIGDTPTPRVFALHGTRVNDAISTQGLPPPDISGSKGTLDETGTLLAYVLVADTRMCDVGSFPPGGSLAETHTLVQDFLDAYNAQDMHRVLQLVSKTISYADCDYARLRVHAINGKPALQRWLRTRFARHDLFIQTAIDTEPPWGPRVFLITFSRQSDDLAQRGLAPYHPLLAAKGTVTSRGNRIQHLGWDSCPHG